jgi:lipopolysaccharide export system permease protein
MINKFLFWRVLRTHIAVTLVLSSVLWLVKALDLMDDLFGVSVGLVDMVYLNLLAWPRILGLTLAPALLIAVLVLLVRLLQDHEYFALTAAGLSPVRILRPVIAAAGLVIIVQALVTFYIAPLASKTLREQTIELKSKASIAPLIAGSFREILPNMTAYAQAQDSDGTWRQIMIFDNTHPHQQTTYIAQRGRFESSDQASNLVLFNGHIRTKTTADASNPASESEIAFTNYAVPLQDALARNEKQGSKTVFNRNHMMIHQLLNPQAQGIERPQMILRMKARGLELIINLVSPLVFMLISFAALTPGGLSRQGYGRRILLAVAAALMFQTGAVSFTVSAAKTNAPALVFLWPLVSLLVLVLIISVQHNPTLMRRWTKRHAA